MIFEGILGNEKNKKYLENIINAGDVSHSYMFIGKASIGKTLFAKEFAKAILCKTEPKPCNKCLSCIKFDNSNHPDFFILDKKNESIKIEEIREIVNKVLEKPIESTKKVYIINNCEMMTTQAQNSLLKTLEEPPEYAVIILITNNENLILNTIKSRSIKVYFEPLSEKNLLEILETKYQYKNLSSKILKRAEGSIEKAIDIYENEETYRKIEEVFTNISNINFIDFINQKDGIFKNKNDILNILEYINVVFYDLSKANEKYFNCVKAVEKAKERLNKNGNYDMTIDDLLFTVWEEINV